MTTTLHIHCDMTAECDQPITHLDDKGYVYCTTHGLQRRDYRPCRKLRPAEINKLQRGEQLDHY